MCNLVRVSEHLVRTIVRESDMTTMGIYEAKTHFSEVIDKVVDGETAIITRQQRRQEKQV
jgi:hypothetical protein